MVSFCVSEPLNKNDIKAIIHQTVWHEGSWNIKTSLKFAAILENVLQCFYIPRCVLRHEGARYFKKKQEYFTIKWIPLFKH